MNLRLRPDQRQKLSFIKANQTKLEEMLQNIAGRRVVVNVEVGGQSEAHPGGPEGDDPARQMGGDSWTGGSSGGVRRLSQIEIDKIMNHPQVRQVAELFNASLVDIREPAAPVEPSEE